MVERTTTLSDLGFDLHFCRTIPYSQGIQKAIEILQGREAVFLEQHVYGPPITDPANFLKKRRAALKALLVEYPESADFGDSEADGSILSGLVLQHRLLVPDVSTLTAIRQGGLPRSENAFGWFGFFADNQTIHVSQDADATNDLGVEVDPVATGLLALALHFYPSLRPGYGWVDEFGLNLPEGKTLAAHRPRFLYWSNFFGPEYVKAVGRDFLKGAPGWSSVDLEDGGILHVATESYQSWWENDQPKLLAYFRQKFPKIEIYRAQPSL